MGRGCVGCAPRPRWRTRAGRCQRRRCRTRRTPSSCCAHTSPNPAPGAKRTAASASARELPEKTPPPRALRSPTSTTARPGTCGCGVRVRPGWREASKQPGGATRRARRARALPVAAFMRATFSVTSTRTVSAIALPSMMLAPAAADRRSEWAQSGGAGASGALKAAAQTTQCTAHMLPCAAAEAGARACAGSVGGDDSAAAASAAAAAAHVGGHPLQLGARAAQRARRRRRRARAHHSGRCEGALHVAALVHRRPGMLLGRNAADADSADACVEDGGRRWQRMPRHFRRYSSDIASAIWRATEK